MRNTSVAMDVYSELTDDIVVVSDEFDDIMNLPVKHVHLVYGTIEGCGDRIAKYRDLHGLIAGA